MENLLYIQHEKSGEESYVFIQDKLISLQSHPDLNLSNFIKVKSYFLKINSRKNPKGILHRNPFNGYVITGVLNEKDTYGRTMLFSCYYNGDLNQLDKYIDNCLNQIDKSINQECLKFIKVNIRRFVVLRNVLLLGVISLMAYQIFK
jgi:hypothetical protein